MRVLLVIALVVLACLLFAADRVIKAVNRGRRRRDVNKRLFAAASVAVAQEQQRRSAAEASGALTSVMPVIHDLGPRKVD
jgi:hypothetical protein